MLLEDAGMSAKTNTIARVVGAFVSFGLTLSTFFFSNVRNTRWPFGTTLWEWAIGVALVIAVIAWIVTPYITVLPYRWARDKIRVASASDLVAAAIGLILGLIISALLAIPLSRLPDIWGSVLPFVGTLLFGYLGVAVAVLRKNDLAHLFQGVMTRRTRDRDEERDRDRNKDRDRDKDH